MKKILILIVSLIVVLFVATVAVAQDYVSPGGQTAGLGTVANNLAAPINAARYAFNAACYIIGAGFFVATLFRFQRFRQNPQEAPLSSIIVLFLIALVLIILPLSYDLSHYWAHTLGIGDMVGKN